MVVELPVETVYPKVTLAAEVVHRHKAVSVTAELMLRVQVLLQQNQTAVLDKVVHINLAAIVQAVAAVGMAAVLVIIKAAAPAAVQVMSIPLP